MSWVPTFGRLFWESSLWYSPVAAFLVLVMVVITLLTLPDSKKSARECRKQYLAEKHTRSGNRTPRG